MVFNLSKNTTGHSASYTDEELLQQFKQSGDSVFIGQLFRRYDHKVLGVCLFYLKDEEESQDAAMEVFTNLLENGQNYSIQNFNSWIYRVTRNHCIKQLQKRLSRMELPTGEFDEPVFVENEDWETLLYRERVLDRLSEAIEELNEGQRTCIVLFYLKGLSYKEIEQRTSFSANEIKSHIQNGRRRLRNKLSQKLGQLD